MISACRDGREWQALSRTSPLGTGIPRQHQPYVDTVPLNNTWAGGAGDERVLDGPAVSKHMGSGPRRDDVRGPWGKGVADQMDWGAEQDEPTGGRAGGGVGGGGGGGRGDEHHWDGATVTLAGQVISLSLYPRLMSILAATEDLNPQTRSVGWLVVRMNELYDARRKLEQASLNAEEDFLNLDSGSRRVYTFPAFVYKHFKHRHGIKHLVRSVCLDVVCNVQLYRKQQPEVEVFARFMEEFYGEKELRFFLDLRAEVYRVTRAGDRRGWLGTHVLAMTLPECVRVAKGIFIDTTTLYFRDLIATVKDQMDTEDVRGGGMRNPDGGRILVSTFLYLAMVCFVSPKEPSEASPQQPPRQHQGLTPSAAPGGRRLFVRSRGSVSPTAYAVGANGFSRDIPGDLHCATNGFGGSSIAHHSPPSTPPLGHRLSSTYCGGGVEAREAGESDVANPGSRSSRAPTTFNATFPGISGRLNYPSPAPSSVLSPPGASSLPWHQHDTSPPIPQSPPFPRPPPAFYRGRQEQQQQQQQQPQEQQRQEQQRQEQQPQEQQPQDQQPQEQQPQEQQPQEQEEERQQQEQEQGWQHHQNQQRRQWEQEQGQQQQQSQSQQHSEQELRQPLQEQQPVSHNPEDEDKTPGMEHPRCDGDSKDLDAPTTRKILGWGRLNSLMKYVKGSEKVERGEEGEIRPDGLSAQDFWSAFSSASSSFTPREEGSPHLPSLPLPTPGTATATAIANATTISASVVENESGLEETTETVGKATTAHPAAESGSGGGSEGRGGGAVAGPAESNTGGNCVLMSSALAAVNASMEDDCLARIDPAIDKPGGSDRGYVEGEGYRTQEACATSQREGEQSRTSLKLRPEGQRSTPAFPPEPTKNELSFSLGGPSCVSRPQGLLERKTHTQLCSPSTSSRSLSTSPLPKQSSGDRQISAPKTLGQGRESVVVAPTPETSTYMPRSSPGRQRGVFDRDPQRNTISPNEPTPVTSIPATVSGSEAEVAKGEAISTSKEDSTSIKYLQSDSRVGNGLGWSHDVASIATDWLASFEQRFMPCLAAEARTGTGVEAGEGKCGRDAEDAINAASGNLGSKSAAGATTRVPLRGGHSTGRPETRGESLLPPGIAQVLHEEVQRALALCRRDLEIVEAVSPELLPAAVVKSFWMLEIAISTPVAQSRALTNMGRLLEARGNPDEAMLCFQEASSADNDSVDALCCRAGNLQRRGDFEGAAFYFAEALGRDKSCWSAWHGLGEVRSVQGNYAGAVEAFSTWIQGQENEEIDRKRESNEFGVKKQVGTAGGAEGGATGIDGGGGGEWTMDAKKAQVIAKGLVHLGDAYMKLEQDKDAQKAFERAILMDDGCWEAHFQLGTLLQARRGQGAEALESFSRAVKAAAAAAAVNPGLVGGSEEAISLLPSL